MRQLLVLLLPTITLAYIEIDLTGTVHSNAVSSKVKTKGFIETVIVEQDRAFMGIQDDRLKQAIEKINGKKPDEVYITDETPFGDLYKRSGWKQVHLKIQPLNNFYYDFKTDTAMLPKTKYRDGNSRPTDILINESGNLTNIIYSYWKKPTNTTGEDIVSILFNFDTDYNSAYFVKTFHFGASNKYIQNKYYEINSTLRLEPAQKVTTELEVLREIMKVEIPYEISLSGDVIARYNVMHNDKYIFRFNIDDIQKANNLTMSHRCYQYLIYQVDIDAHIHIRDSNGLILQSIPVGSGVSMKGKKKATNKHHAEAEGISATRKKMTFEVPEDLALETGFTDDDEESEENMEKTVTEAKLEKKEN